MSQDLILFAVAAVALFSVRAELLRRIERLQKKNQAEVLTERVRLGDFQIGVAGQKLEIHYQDTLIAEIDRDALRLHGASMGNEGQRAEYASGGFSFYDRGAIRASLDVSYDAESALILATGERFRNELPVERDPTPPPAGYGSAGQRPSRAGIALVVTDEGSAEIWVANSSRAPKRIA